jgi:uncharacterized protein (DUF1684 family)
MIHIEPTRDAEEAPDPLDRLALADWRRRVSDIYADVRRAAATDPADAWRRWVSAREALFRDHAQSPVPPANRASFSARHFDYDPALRFEGAVEAEQAEPGGASPAGAAAGAAPGGGGAAVLDLPVSAGGTMSFTRIGWLAVPFPDGQRRLALYWMAGYAGGLFLPFRDATNGKETYGAGRYLLDAAKSADLGPGTSPGALVLDFNFSFQPSCAFDPKWACPLAPRENWLDIPIRAGERLG